MEVGEIKLDKKFSNYFKKLIGEKYKIYIKANEMSKYLKLDALAFGNILQKYVNVAKFNSTCKQYENYFTNVDKNNIRYKQFLYFIKHKTAIPYWIENLKTVSDKLFVPIPKNYRNTKLPTQLKNSWFKSNVLTSVQKNTNEIVIDANKVRIHKPQLKTTKIKLFLNKEQRECIKYLFGVYRYYYNRAISYINNYNKTTKTTFFHVDYKDETTKMNVDLTDVKNKFSMITMRKYLGDNIPNWMNQGVIVHLIDKAFSEASVRYSTCMSVFYKTGKPFDLHFKKYTKIQTMNIEARMISLINNHLNLFYTFKFKCKFSNSSKCVMRNINASDSIFKFDFNDSSISYNKYTDTYFLNLSYTNKRCNLVDLDKKQEKTNSILEQRKVISCDPGVRTFGTFYCDNKVMEIGITDKNDDKIYKCCKEIDILTSISNKTEYFKKDVNGNAKIYKVNSHRKRQLKEALHRKYEKLKNMKKELHDKTINYLLLNSGKIIIPPFKTSQMACKLHSTVARRMYTLSHYEFRQKLINKCNEYDVEIVIEDEHYTSKTCSCCGTLNYSLGSIKIFDCQICKVKMDRDFNGARGIMLKNNEW